MAGNTVTVDKLGNYFQVIPGTAVQAGTSIPVSTGNVDTLALAFSLVPSARAFTSVFTIENITTQSRTAVPTLNGPAQVASAVFASTGTTSATPAAGAGTFSGSCSGGSFTITVSSQKNKAVGFSVSAADAAGNTSGAATPSGFATR